MGSITTRGSSEKIGDVKVRAVGAGAPPGWLVCNGALISRTVYAALFDAIGETYGAGDGSTTFAVPDMRGEFLRGHDGARGVDPARVFGSWQGGELASHGHGIESYADTSVIGSAVATGGRARIAITGEDENMVSPPGWFPEPTGKFRAAAVGGSETRPRNVAMRFCIKYAG